MPNCADYEDDAPAFIMPDHVHAILWFVNPGQLSECMKQWKRTSSVRIGRLFDDVLTAYGSKATVRRTWQAKYYVFNIYSRRRLEEKLQYMHQNPVRAGLVARAAQWRWSSARYYELGKSVGVMVSWIE